MQIQFPSWYRKFGIKQIQQVVNPRFFDLAFLDLPLESIYHYVEYDGVNLGPARDDYLFRNTKRAIPVETVTNLVTHDGNPRRTGVSAPALIKEYFHRHRQMKAMRDIEQGGRDKQAIVVYNYALLGKEFKYQQGAMAGYFRWKNIFATVLSTIARVAPHSPRQHFLYVAAPKVLPSYHQLVDASKVINQGSLKFFRDNNSYILLELWRWLTDHHEESLFSVIPKNKLHLVNLLFQESGRWSVLNLGVLNSFRKPTSSSAEDEGYVLQAKSQISGIQVAKRLLHLYMVTMELRTITTKTDPGQFDDEKTQDGLLVQAPESGASALDDEDDDDDVSQTTVRPGETDAATVTKEVEILTSLSDVDAHQLLDDLEPEEFNAFITEQDKLLDEKFKQLDEIIARTQAKADSAKPTIEAVVLDNPTHAPEHHVLTLLDRLADEGVISPGEHRRFERLASNYKTILAPDGVSTLEQFSVIKPEVLKIESIPPMVGSPPVLDQSMRYSTLNVFDKRYIEEVFHRDQVNMILSLQKAGIAVTNYKVEKTADILGAYEDHTLKITPIIGVPSTLRFKLPVITPEGVFTSNGVPYRMRKQRTSNPIHKIAPDRVALTTYYGKTFVTRGRTQASDYGAWLKAQVLTRVLDRERAFFQDPIVADVFDAELTAPRNYTAISTTLQSATIKGYYLNFDHRELIKLEPQAAQRFEKDGSLLLGTNHLGGFLVIDRFGRVFTTDMDVLTPAGTLEDFLEIQTQHAPVEYSSVSVFGKSIPVGIVLGLEMGLHNLLDLLRVEPRIVPAGERLRLQPREFAISFSDESIVLSRDHKLASLILGGFNEFAKTLKAFSIYSFDKRGVYVNLLEASGLGARYVRELDLMYALFVDPISQEILLDMKEPTTFKGLLFRSSQLLLNDQHPDELDPAYMRIRGYERLAGAIYTELIQSLRVHNGRLGKANAQIEMKPYAVWERITKDPSKMQVKEINPIMAIKETEAATFAGTGGRNKRAMTKNTRAFHPNDVGTISESTVDSSDVGINMFTSANPQFTSLRGMSGRFDMAKSGPASLLSTSALLAPFSDRDDQLF